MCCVGKAICCCCSCAWSLLMMILGVGLLIVIAVALGVYFGVFHNQADTVNASRDEQPRLLLELIHQAVTHNPKSFE